MLLKWYGIDQNNVPPFYYLKSLEDEGLKQEWKKTDSKRISEVLSHHAQAAKFEDDTLMKYTRSVTELEIQEGIFKTKDCNFRCLAFFRTMNVFEQMQPGKVPADSKKFVGTYVDMDKDKDEVEITSQQLMKQLKQRITNKLRPKNVSNLSVGINSISELKQCAVFEEKFENYLVEFSSLFEKAVMNLVEANMNKNEILFQLLEKHADLFHHIRFCHEKSLAFLGRDELIEKIKTLLVHENQQYVIINGSSGSGKTTLIAKVATMLKTWFPNTLFTLVLRFIGTSEDSYNIQNLLSSIIKQLGIRFNVVVNYEEMSPIDKLYNYFKKFLIEVNKETGNEQQIFIFLDSLDQLSPEYAGRKLDWFPTGLPANIRFVVSTLTEIQYESFPAIQNIIGNDSSYIEIAQLREEEVPDIIRYRLNNAERTLTSDQMEFLGECFKKCSIPLYIKLIMDQAVEWKHSTRRDQLSVSNDVKRAIHDLLEKLEESYGGTFVKTVLQYMTLSRHGFFENYLQNILAHDETVLNYINKEFSHDKVSGNRIPQIFLIRLIHALREYLSGPMYRWYHRAFWEVALKRYCQDTESNQKCHKTIVETYQHERFNRLNPFWMNELPYHATCANEIDNLKRNFLLNLIFMQLKTEYSDVDQLIADYAFAVQQHQQDQTLKLVYQVLLIAAYKIRFDPLQLPGQLFGRLHGYQAGPDLEELLEQCLSPPQEAIVPSKNFMAGPNSLLSNSIIAHKTEIKSTLITNDTRHIISCSLDNCIKLFDADTFAERKTIFKNYDSTTSLTISKDDTVLYAWCRKAEDKQRDQPMIEAYNLNTGEHLFNVYSDILGNDQSKHREVLFSDVKDELWLVTKVCWYRLNWQSGQIQSTLAIPQEFAKNEDKIICIDKAQTRIVMALDIHSLVLSLDENGDNVLRDLKDETVMGRRFLILPDFTLLISTRRRFKSLLDDDDMEWYILLCDLLTLEIIKRIPVSKALRIWKSSLDGAKIFCNAFNYIYVLDIQKRQTQFILEHSSQMNSCSLLNEKTIISATWDNKLHVWDLNTVNSHSNQPSNGTSSVNLFETFNSRMIRFLYDDCNTLSRYVFVYNIFNENMTEIFVLFDLSTQCPVRKCEIDGYSRNDLQPISFINRETVLLICLSKRQYLFLNIDQFTIDKQLECDQTRVFKRINPKQVIMSIRDSSSSISSLVSLDCDNLSYEIIIPNWIGIEWHSINSRTIIFKKASEQIIYAYNFSERCLTHLLLDISDKTSIAQVMTSNTSTYVAIICTDTEQTKSISVYQMNKLMDERGRQRTFFSRKNLHDLGQPLFIGDQYLVYQYKEKHDRLTYCIDLPSNIAHKWFQDDDSKGSFDCLKHERSRYIWYQRYQVSRLNKVKTDISVYHTQDVSKPVATLDVDCRLKINQVALLDNGNAFLVKVLDKLEFVAFFLKSRTVTASDNVIKFDQFKVKDSTTIFVLRNESYIKYT